VILDYSDQEGSVMIDRSLYREFWNDDSVSVYRLYLNERASVDEVRRSILGCLSEERRVFVMTNEEIRGYVTRLAEQWFSLTYAQLATGVLIALLGIVNTLTVSITERKRELGILQAVGALRNQIRMTVWLEATAIGAVGLILGLVLGAVNLYFMVDMMQQDVAGHRFSFTYPVKTAVWLIPVILATAFISSLGPAESALRESPREALEYE
jgi:putative ABC transport system permease protein